MGMIDEKMVIYVNNDYDFFISKMKLVNITDMKELEKHLKFVL